LRRLAIALVVALALAALGATYALASTKTITAHDNFYSKSSITIRKGDRVNWRWSNTSNRHNVFLKGHFKSKSGHSGNFTARFTKRGTYRIICTLHPVQMTMKVIVK
jgi:plastocyanin